MVELQTGGDGLVAAFGFVFWATFGVVQVLKIDAAKHADAQLMERHRAALADADKWVDERFRPVFALASNIKTRASVPSLVESVQRADMDCAEYATDQIERFVDSRLSSSLMATDIEIEGGATHSKVHDAEEHVHDSLGSILHRLEFHGYDIVDLNGVVLASSLAEHVAPRDAGTSGQFLGGNRRNASGATIHVIK